MTVVLDALQGAVAAMSKLFMVMGIGMASAHFGFLNRQFVPQLSGWTFVFLSVCQVISNLARQISIEKLQLYFPLLIWSSFNVLSGYLCGYVFCLIYKPRKEYRSTLMAAAAYSNAIGLPIVVFDSLAYSVFTSDTMTPLDAIQQSTAMCFVYSVPWNLMMYIIGYPRLLELKQNASNTSTDGDDQIVNNENIGVNLDDLGSIPSLPLSPLPTSPSYQEPPSPFVDYQEQTLIYRDASSTSMRSANLRNDNNQSLQYGRSMSMADSDIIIQPLGLGGLSQAAHLPPIIYEETEFDDSPTPRKRRIQKTDIQDSSYYNHELDLSNHNINTNSSSPSANHLSHLVNRLDLDINQDLNYKPAPVMVCLKTTNDVCSLYCGKLLSLFQYYILNRLSPGIQFTVTMIFTNPPTVATLLSIVIGLTPPLKRPFFDTDGIFHFIIKAIDFISVSASPISSMISAASIYHSVVRNFGPESRQLQRVIDLVSETQDKITAEKLIPQDQHGLESNPPSPSDMLNQSQQPFQPPIAPNISYIQSTIPHSTTNLSQQSANRRAAPSPGVFPQPSPHLHAMVNSINNVSHSFSEHQNPSNLPKQQSNTQMYQNIVKNSPYLPPLHATMGSDDVHDLEMLDRSYSYLPQAPSKPINTQNNNSTTHGIISSTMVILNGKTPSEIELEMILSKIDPAMPLEVDEDNNILPLPRLSWAAMIGFTFTRLICAPALTYFMFLIVQAIGGTFEEIILPKSALYRCYILIASASASADSILMIITKAYRTRQSMMLSLIYVVQYAACLVTLTGWIVLVVSTNIQYK